MAELRGTTGDDSLSCIVSPHTLHVGDGNDPLQGGLGDDLLVWPPSLVRSSDVGRGDAGFGVLRRRLTAAQRADRGLKSGVVGPDRVACEVFRILVVGGTARTVKQTVVSRSSAAARRPSAT